MCITSQNFRYEFGRRCFTLLTCPIHQSLITQGEHLTNRTAVSALVVLLVLLVFREMLPWVVLAVVFWWIWKAVSKLFWEQRRNNCASMNAADSSPRSAPVTA